jgi:cytochrome b
MRVLVWDWPTRLVHWLLVALVIFSWWSAEEGHMDWHRYSGYTLLGVLVFRVYWGLAGAHTARFAQFVKGPRAVVVLLALLVTQVALGLFAVDIDGLESGPLSHLVSFDTGRVCAEVHEAVFNVLMLFVTLHIAAVFAYLLFKKQNLIGPMITGRMEAADGSQPAHASLVRVAIGVIVAALVAWWIA